MSPLWTCQHCGTEFRRKRRGDGKPSRYCDQACYHASRKGKTPECVETLAPVPCEQCGSPMKPYKNQSESGRRRFCSVQCSAAARRGTDGPRGPDANHWQGGRVRVKGYVLVKRPDHPNAWQNGYIPEHRLIVSEQIGRPLRKGEVVHHKNGQKDDNRPENLELTDWSEHRALHATDRWSRKWDACRDCGTTERRHSGRGYCSTCYGRNVRR